MLRYIIPVIGIAIVAIRNIYSPQEQQTVEKNWEPASDTPDNFPVQHAELPFEETELKENQVRSAVTFGQSLKKQFGLAFFYNLQRNPSEEDREIECQLNLKGANQGWVEQIEVKALKDNPNVTITIPTPLMTFNKKDGNKKTFIFSKKKELGLINQDTAVVKVNSHGRLVLGASTQTEGEITPPVASCKYKAGR